MNCKHVKDMLVTYLDSGANTEEKASIEAHITHCPDCMAEREALSCAQNNFRQTMQESIDTLDVPAHTLVAIKRRITQEKSSKLPMLHSIKAKVSRWVQAFWLRPLWQRAIASTLAVALIAALVVTQLVVGLSPQGPPQTEPLMIRNPLVSDDGWGWQNPKPQGDGLNDIWGSSSDDIFAVGVGGTIIHYDGSEWNPMTSGTKKELSAVWGSGPQDVFAAQAEQWGGYKGSDLEVDTVILHYDGSTWSKMDSGTTGRIFGIWGSASDNVYAVGSRGNILHYDGNAWTKMDSGVTGGILGIWGSGPNDIFAVGVRNFNIERTTVNGNFILHYDGTEWSEMDSGTEDTLLGVWGSASDDVFAVGGNGTILHYDGNSWTAMDSDTSQGISSIWGSAPNNIFAKGHVGYNDAILHYDGNSWSITELVDIRGLDRMWGSASDNVYAVGYAGAIAHYNGNSWSPLEQNGAGRSTQNFRDIWGSAPDDIYAVGDGSNTLGSKETIMHYDGNGWTLMDSPATSGLTSIWGSSATDVFAYGWGNNNEDVPMFSMIIHYDGTTWEVMDTGDLLEGPNEWSSVDIDDIWGSGPNDVYAVGNYMERVTVSENEHNITKIEAVILHYDGTSWSRVDIGAKQYVLSSVWGSSSTNVFASGRIISSFHGSGYGSSDSVIMHYDGNAWSEMDTGNVSISISGQGGIWGSSSTNVFVAGHDIYHYDGSAWSTMTINSRASFDDVWGSASKSVYAAGHDGAIYHYNGADWTKMDSDTTGELKGIWGTSTTNVYAVGGHGTILHYKENLWLTP